MSQHINQLNDTIKKLVKPNTGILAADESTGTIEKRFNAINVESNEELRRQYRSLLCTAPGLNESVAGIILFEETLGQKTDDGTLIPDFLLKQNILPGIKVDKGLTPLAQSPNEKITQGLDGLDGRIKEYVKQGAKFAKWRNVYTIGVNLPTKSAIMANSEMLARYAAICQVNGVVPIVEPEVLMDGNHNLEICKAVSERVFFDLFKALHRHHVSIEHIVLKPNMIIPGKDCQDQSNPEDIAKATIAVLARTVPAAVPSINFLSGGQSSLEATANLNAINSQGPQPWQLSFSYGRALQELSLKAWGGDKANFKKAQDALLTRAKFNALAVSGDYQQNMEVAAA